MNAKILEAPLTHATTPLPTDHFLFVDDVEHLMPAETRAGGETPQQVLAPAIQLLTPHRQAGGLLFLLEYSGKELMIPHGGLRILLE